MYRMLPKEPATIATPPHNNLYVHIAGAAILVINKLRKLFEGYTDPRGFSANDIERAVAYDISVVTSWEQYLTDYTGEKKPFSKKHILELGPGADLGIGLLLLARGARRYTAFDKHNLMADTPPKLYESLLGAQHSGIRTQDRHLLRAEITKALRGASQRLNYRVDPTFSVQTITPAVDVIVSQAAFEHFEHIPELARALSAIARTGAVLCAVIDLQTHSRYVREHDPLNIYRYSDWFYRLCAFSGSPNRIRPHEYKKAFTAAGWHNVRVIPLTRTDAAYYQKTLPYLAQRFRHAKHDMRVIACLLLATKT